MAILGPIYTIPASIVAFASWNDLCRIGRSFTLYRIALQQHGVTFISPTERYDIHSTCGASPTGQLWHGVNGTPIR